MPVLFEEWVTSIFHARKALELMESRNGLYVLYVDRVTGLLGKQVSQVSSLQNIKPDILDKLLCWPVSGNMNFFAKILMKIAPTALMFWGSM